MAELPGNIVQARESAQAAAGRAGELASQEFTIGDVLKQKTLDLYKNNQDIVQPLDVATSQYVTAPGEAREKYQDVFNPFSRENLVSQYTQNQALPMLSLSSVLGQRFGRVDDTIGAGTRAFQAQSAAQQAQAQQAQQLYSNLMGEYSMSENIRAQQESEAFGREQFEWDKIFSEKKLAQGDGGGGGGGGLEELLRIILGNQNDPETPSGPEPPPMTSRPGAVQEYQGWIWESDGRGGWV